MEPNIAIVILNWNGKKLLETFLPKVLTYSKEATIYVADNASTDDSIVFLKSTFPQIKIIQNRANFGFAKGYNEALKEVDEDILCLLNSDVEVTNNWLQPVLDIFENDSETVIVQPKLLDYKQKDFFEYAGAAGGFIDKYGYPYCRGRIFDTIEKDSGQYDETASIFWASGACFFIRKNTFNELGGFDESFFAHMEEIDLCWRCKNLGYKIIYAPLSTVYHVGGATLQKSNPKKTFLNFRNSLYTLVKNGKGNVFFLIFARLILDGIAGLVFILKLKPQDCVAIIKAHFSFYTNLPRLLKQRKVLAEPQKYYSIRSIVWRYFVLKQKKFGSL